MKFQLDINIPPMKPPMLHQSKILLIGSCFTEHMSHFLNRAKFKTLQNPHGILFNPFSVCKSLRDVIEKKTYSTEDLFLLNEYWHSWFHHSDFSDLNPETALKKINTSIEEHHAFLKQADYLIITLGSAFAYQLLDKKIWVSNNHRAPAQWFEKTLLSISSIYEELNLLQQQLRSFNPSLQFIYTISPVRHVRDGVIENNRSKARLLEVVHALSESYYFPAYELVIDILRDYRFYDVDMVHPNYAATSFVWEQFVSSCIDPNCYPLMKKMEQIYKARSHRSKDSKSLAHQSFLHEHAALCLALKEEFPYLDLEEELQYFQQTL